MFRFMEGKEIVWNESLIRPKNSIAQVLSTSFARVCLLVCPAADVDDEISED